MSPQNRYSHPCGYSLYKQRESYHTPRESLTKKRTDSTPKNSSFYSTS